MTTVLPRHLQPIYELADLLREEASSLAVRPAVPGEADREEIVLKKLGARGWSRLHHFRYFYGPGWGENASRPLSPRALEGFYRFLEQAHFPEDCTPSLFFAEAGHLELCWEDAAGKAVQVEFTPAGGEFYREADEREGFVSYENLAQLPHELSLR